MTLFYPFPLFSTSFPSTFKTTQLAALDMMYTQVVVFTFLAVSQVSFAAPTDSRVIRRQSHGESSGLSPSDVAVVELALFLEHLEYNLYTGGYENFADNQYTQYGFPKGLRDAIGIIAQQEDVHANMLAQVLTSNGLTPIPNCTYRFPYSNPKGHISEVRLVSWTTEYF